MLPQRPSPSAPSRLRCAECGSRLAHDQRYCLDCGARRGALAPAIARWIGLQAPAAPLSAHERADAPGDAADSAQVRREPSLPSPRILAVAIMALLAFGVLVGSAVRPREGAGRGPLVVAVAHATQAPGAAAVAEAPTPPPSAAPEEKPLPASSESTAPTSTQPAGKPKSTQPSKTTSPSPESGSPTPALPAIKHVFLIVLSDQGFDQAFGPGAPVTYLSKTLVGQGELLEDYYAISGGELANEIALISGQGPTVQTAEDCPTYTAITPGTVGALGQVLGSGCVYPRSTATLAEQLSADGLTWGAYVEGIGEGAAEPGTCPHPALGGADGNHVPSAADAYVTWRDPFVYFEGVTDNASCASAIVGIGALAPSLKAAKSTPALAYIVPDRCHDGSEEPCAPGQPAGLAATDSFLSTVVPEIEGSPAYKTGGLIAITFDQAPQSGPDADSSGCCMTSPFPNLPAGAPSATSTTASPAATGTTGEAPATSTGTVSAAPAGGGRVGLLLISRYTTPGSINVTGEYDDFSLLASIEDLFGVSHLGYAGSEGLLLFNKSVYNAHP